MLTFLTDYTGNRRFYPLYCDPTRAKVNISTDRSDNYYPQQIWAEAMHYYSLKHPAFIDKRIGALAETMQDFATVEDPNALIVERWLDYNRPAIGDFTTRDEILEYALHVPDGELVDKERNSAYRVWSNSTKKWQKIPYPIKDGGKSKRGYKRIAPPDGAGIYGFQDRPVLPTLMINRISEVFEAIHSPDVHQDDDNQVEWLQ